SSLERLVDGGHTSVYVARCHQDLGVDAEEPRVHSARERLAKSIEASAQQPCSGCDIASFGRERAFKAQAAGIIAHHSQPAGLLLETSNGPLGGLEITAPQRDAAARPSQSVTE